MDIGDILSSLSAEDIQSLQNIASSLSGNMQNNQNNTQSPPQTASPNEKQPPEQKPLPPQIGGFGGSLGDLTGIISKLGSAGNDPRCQLISALKPMLSPEKQQRADEAIRIIKLLDLLPVLKDSGILKGVLGQ